jgi:hypothetical protein
MAMEGSLLFGAWCQRGSEITIGATSEGFVAALSILASSLICGRFIYISFIVERWTLNPSACGPVRLVFV